MLEKLKEHWWILGLIGIFSFLALENVRLEKRVDELNKENQGLQQRLTE